MRRFGAPRIGLLLTCLLVCAPAFAADVSVRAPALRLPLGDTADYHRGLQLDVRGEHAAAVQAYRAAFSAPGRTGSRARFQAKLSDGIVKLRESVARSPDSYDEQFNIGVNIQNKYYALFLDTGLRNHRLFALAEHHFQRAMRLHPTAANPLLCLAGLYAQAGDRGRAMEVFAQMGPRIIGASDHYNLAFFRKVTGEVDAAFQMLRVAVQYDNRHRAWILESDDFMEYLEDPRMQAILATSAPHGGVLGRLRIGPGGRPFGIQRKPRRWILRRQKLQPGILPVGPAPTLGPQPTIRITPVPAPVP